VSYDVAVWLGELPASHEDATTVFKALFEQYVEGPPVAAIPQLAAFAVAVERISDDDWDITVSGPIAYIALTRSEVAAATGRLSQLADDHGLIYFDASKNRLHNAPPQHGISTRRRGNVAVPEHWMSFLADALRDPTDFVLIEDRRADHYIQAANSAGTLLLEYRDGSPRQHFQTTVSNHLELADALQQWLAGETDFIGDHSWQRLTDWD
jgi:hypothetical protein